VFYSHYVFKKPIIILLGKKKIETAITYVKKEIFIFSGDLR